MRFALVYLRRFRRTGEAQVLQALSARGKRGETRQVAFRMDAT